MGKLAKRSAAITVVAASVVGAGVAFAAWTSNGTGTGTATAGQAVDLTITQSGTASGLFPTGQVNVPFTVKNTNPYAITLATAKASNFKVDAAHSACNIASVSGVDMTLSDVVATGATSSPKNMVVKMDNTAADACQGATFTFDIKVTGASS